MPSKTEWDRRYLRLAREIASWSRDPSTKVGTVLVDAQHIPLSLAYNGFVSGLRDAPERLNNRETRLKLTLHGEENAIINAGKSGHAILGATCYVWPLAPCVSCASKLVQAGVRTIVTVTASPAITSRWGDDLALAQAVYNETGVDLLIYEPEFLDD